MYKRDTNASTNGKLWEARMGNISATKETSTGPKRCFFSHKWWKDGVQYTQNLSSILYSYINTLKRQRIIEKSYISAWLDSTIIYFQIKIDELFVDNT